MWISDFAIRRPVVTTVVMLALVVFGIIAFVLLDTDEFPEINPPVVAVSLLYPGASPTTVETEVVNPVEEAIAGISGIDRITSMSLDGYALVTAEFVFEKDVQQATQDIRDRISEIRNDLPPELEEPILTRFDPNDLPIISLTLSSDRRDPAELTRLADPGVVAELRSVSGVAQVDVVGGLERELTIEIDPHAMQAANVTVANVVATLQAQNLAAPVGRITAQLEERTIRLQGRLEAPDDFADIAVMESAGRIVRLGEIARVSDGSEEQRTLALYNGEPAVGIDVVKTTNASTTAVSEAVRARVDAIREQLPEDVELRVIRDAGVRVEHSVNDVKAALFEGAILTVIVVFLFLNSWRSTVITGLALPVSVLASFIAVWAFGFTLNTMSLLGLSLAIGILIDDAIVVRENIVRHMELGKDHLQAAHEGTAEIGLAVAATTFSIVVVFVPIAFMGGIAGQWFKPMALTIATSVLVSLVVSFSLDPMLSAYWPDPDAMGEHRSWITRRLARFNEWFDRRTDDYKRIIGWALEHRLATIAIAIASFFAALAMPALGIIGSEFFPEQDLSEFNVEIDTPPGSSIEYTRLKAEEAAAIARSMDGVAYTYVTIGGQTGAVDEANIYVRLTPRGDRERHQSDISGDLRTRLESVAGATAGLASGWGPEKEIEIQIVGPDARVLTQLAERTAAEMRQVEGAVDVALSTEGEKPEIDVRLDRALASSIGVTAADVAQALRPAFAGIDVGDWIDPTGETRDVTIRLLPGARTSITDLEALPLVVPGSRGAPVTAGARATGTPGAAAGAAMIPLGQIASIERATGPAQIDHLDRRRVISVGANTQDRPLNAVVADIEERIAANVTFPPGYSRIQGGETEDQAEVFTSIMVSLAIAIMLMYMILVIQFSSFLDPIPIMMSLPLSLIGVMLALLVTGSTLNLMSMIGVILLMGIVAKNAILLIDFAKWSEEDGMDRHAAIINAGGVRLRPIIMTSVAIIAGMMPVAIGAGEGADFRAPLGRAVIGGVITSTLLTLLVIPTAYDILSGWRDRAIARIGQRRHRGTHSTPRPAPAPGTAPD